MRCRTVSARMSALLNTPSADAERSDYTYWTRPARMLLAARLTRCSSSEERMALKVMTNLLSPRQWLLSAALAVAQLALIAVALDRPVQEGPVEFSGGDVIKRR